MINYIFHSAEILIKKDRNFFNSLGTIALIHDLNIITEAISYQIKVDRAQLETCSSQPILEPIYFVIPSHSYKYFKKKKKALQRLLSNTTMKKYNK